MTSQCAKPRGWLGRVVLWSMNKRHGKVTDWGLRQISIRHDDTILDVGCGGGRTIAKLAVAAPAGKVFGIDYSDQSVATARRVNQQDFQAGRVAIERASVSDLPFADNTFDLVTAVETHFWWGDISAGMREIFRVLKEGGQMVMIAEFYNGGKYAKYADRIKKLTSMAVLDADEHRSLFADAGFREIRVVEDPPAGWICVVGRK
jgi:ubiquinone/menaquinone biosynthesis C-methylase UbiE